MARRKRNRPSILRAEAIIKAGALAARNQMVAGSHEIQHWTSDLGEIHRPFADPHLVLDQQVFLEAVFDELAKCLARDRNIVVDPSLHGEKAFEKLLVG